MATGDFDIRPGTLPPDDVVDVSGVGEGIEVPAVIGFELENAGAHDLFTAEELLVAELPQGSSLLGRDVLNRFQLVYTEREGLLLVTALDD